MKFAILVVIAAGCAGRANPAAAPESALPDFAAARWVPARPAYVLASHSLVDAQRAARDAIELFAAVTGYDVRDAMQTSSALFGVDVLHADPLAAIGVDVRGGWALFGDDVNPTLVVHLAAPAQMAAFLDHQRDRGLVTRSVVVDRVELVTAAIPIGVTLSWAIDGEWMWVHLTLSGTSDDARWFTASHAGHAGGWTGHWAWAQRAANAAAGVVGFLDLHGVHTAITGAAARLPDAVACARLVEPIGRVALAVSGDEHHAAARVALDVGSTERLRAMLLPPPSGWDAAAAGAPIAAQWNLDLAAARPALAPCLALVGAPVALLDETGVRAARGVLVAFDPDAWSGSGAVALDVTGPAYFERQLDRIPLRRRLESDRTFGPYRGHAIDIPFGVTIEYVLDRQRAMLAIGEGLLARMVAPPRGPVTVPPIAAIDLAPPAMPANAWQAVIDGLVARGRDRSSGTMARRIVEHLMAWRDGHLAVRAEGSEIVVTASGNRR